MIETPMKIKSIVPYFGCKRSIADDIIRLIGRHVCYWEIFCGSMAILLSKPVCRTETVCDLNGELTNLGKVLQAEDSAVELYKRLSRTLICEDLFHEAAGRYRNRGYRAADDGPDVDRAYDYFICSWMGRSGVIGTQGYNQGFCMRYSANGGHGAKRWQSAIESIPAWHTRLMNVLITRRNAFDVLEKIPDEKGTVIYADPPYFEKGAKYIFDFEDSDHIRLAELLNKFRKTRVVLSYYDHELLDVYYPAWQRHKIEVNKSLSLCNRPGSEIKTATEVVLVNEHSEEGLFR